MTATHTTMTHLPPAPVLPPARGRSRRLSVRVPAATYDALDRRAASEGEAVAVVLRRILRAAVSPPPTATATANPNPAAEAAS